MNELFFFNSSLLTKHRETFQKIKLIQPKILTDLILSDWKMDLPFSFSESILSIKAHVSNFKPRFEDVSSKNLTGNSKTIIIKVISEAFKQTNINFKNVEDYIKNHVSSRLYQCEVQVAFLHDNFPKIIENEQQYAVFMCNGFFIGISWKQEKVLHKLT